MDSSQDSSLQSPALAAIKDDPSHILSTPRRAHDSSTNNSSTAFIHDIALNAQRTAIATLQQEKLELGKDSTKYLCSVLKETSSLQAGCSLTEEERAACLTTGSVAKQRDFKSDLSHIVTELAQSVNGICRQEDPVLVLNEVIPKLIERETTRGDEGLEFPEHFWELPGIVEQDFRPEKLDASKETACFLKSALGYLDDKEHRHEVGRLFEETAFMGIDYRRPRLSPLYIGPGTQHACDPPDDQNDPNVADSSQGIENIPTDENRTDEPQELATSKYFSFQTMVKPDESGKGPIDDAHQRTIESNDRAEVGTSEAMPEKTVPDRQHYTRSRRNQKVISDAPESTDESPPGIKASNASPSLGTLSSFMQTRGRWNKRRKIQNTSPYFNSPLAPSVDTERETNTEGDPPEQTDLENPPTDDSNPYPQFPPRESERPLLLILSTSLLHTNRPLINSLEGLSSPVSRLIFRDYTTQNSAVLESKIAEEADIIPSPKTGIILTTSQQTTQTHLPGQGSPGLSSPLKERIVRVARRYETLYVLVQVPSSLDPKTFSSIRELSVFCLSLGRICTIQTLLVQTDHTLEWVLSIATKHAVSIATSSESNTQAETLWPSYLDEQTQWEIFLRRAGLNPFAAQSVLDILRNSSTMPYQDDTSAGRQVRDLSTFIELSREARRELFQDAIGQRVLQRVENEVEMDWQVEWAVDLS
ncbi:hypothetical protein PISL3812_01262 [Talaromyces islandicus]|uniref:Uncharacterized protein n=1 Tax=Talaromyces islandicus TaxID=28573 RepID=A0A0U1LNC4_TALIS|nr:hypothetical protein PISL3812_01262 [Talaromyces islandicus]